MFWNWLRTYKECHYTFSAAPDRIDSISWDLTSGTVAARVEVGGGGGGGKGAESELNVGTRGGGGGGGGGGGVNVDVGSGGGGKGGKGALVPVTWKHAITYNVLRYHFNTFNAHDVLVMNLHLRCAYLIIQCHPCTI